MAVSLPYDVIKAIEDAVPQGEQAEKVIRAIERMFLINQTTK